MNVSPSEVKSVLKSLLYVYVKEREKQAYLNFTNPYLAEQEEIAASLYILIVVGFFGFLLFSLMMTNIVYRQRENYMDYLYSEKFSGSRMKARCKLAMRTMDNSTISVLSATGHCQNTNKCPTAEAEAPSLQSVLSNV
ncbi:hypothetical protein JRQ81_020064 [Phrynocephalus forsythii]|uniref:Uncharacterized protein n=1 Tax=Phrynocephalus forsythii TaxID=171643 RepID=A0A9Q0XP40_9SAUR|nr:hypothetical protein JRQ81_020064 [Phrynocephalus forsythii]